MKKFLVTLLAFAFCGISAANEDLRIADSCYTARAEHAVGDKANAKNAKLMIDSYRKAMNDASVEERAPPKVMSGACFSLSDLCISKNTNARPSWTA